MTKKPRQRRFLNDLLFARVITICRRDQDTEWLMEGEKAYILAAICGQKSAIVDMVRYELRKELKLKRRKK